MIIDRKIKDQIPRYLHVNHPEKLIAAMQVSDPQWQELRRSARLDFISVRGHDAIFLDP